VPQVIIHPRGHGGICVLIAHRADGTPLSDLPIEEVARKDVPAGVAYRIVEDTDIPSDRSQRDLWTADFSNPDGHGIGAEAWFAKQEAIAAAAEQQQEPQE
jgi:hypothetical protein